MPLIRDKEGGSIITTVELQELINSAVSDAVAALRSAEGVGQPASKPRSPYALSVERNEGQVAEDFGLFTISKTFESNGYVKRFGIRTEADLQSLIDQASALL